MGHVGSAGDNAVMEWFFALLQKNVLDRRHWATRDDLQIEIITWIERTYHHRRRRARLRPLTAIDFESTMTPQTATAAQQATVTSTRGSPADRLESAVICGIVGIMGYRMNKRDLSILGVAAALSLSVAVPAASASSLDVDERVRRHSGTSTVLGCQSHARDGKATCPLRLQERSMSSPGYKMLWHRYQRGSAKSSGS